MCEASRGGIVIFKDKLIDTLIRKGKGQPGMDQTTIATKLRRQERLTENEFWDVYASIRKEGPEVKYQNPDNWISHEE